MSLVLVEGGRHLLTANRLSGTVSVIDSDRRIILAEHPIGETLSDLTALPDDRFLLATDDARHQLLLLRRDGQNVRAIARIDVPPYPVSVRATDDGRRCFVSSLWSRRLTIIDVVSASSGTDAAPALRVAGSVHLPFAPRLQVWVPAARRLIVTDAFGGYLAVVDPQQPALESVRALPAHNIAGLLLGTDGKSLLVSHQLLNGRARTEANDVHWGIFITNLLRILSIETVLDKQATLLQGGNSVLLGDVGKAGGDPAGIALAPENRYVVALSGVGQIAVAQPEQAIQYRLSAGTRPIAVVTDGDRAFVADAFGDAVHVLNVVAGEPLATISLGPQPQPTALVRGEHLFYNARLSHDGWMSCHSCHTDGHSNGLLSDNLGDGDFNAPKRVLSLLGVAETSPWAWNGRVAELEAQIRKSVTSTMLGKPLSESQVSDLAAFLRTLRPPPAKVLPSDNEAIERGRQVFTAQACHACHKSPTYTTARTYDVGFKDESGNAAFNPPSLRGVGHRDRLFHDNRARSLEEVFTKHKHQIDVDLSSQELSDLFAFLRSL